MEFTIDQRHRGPDGSGNGGWSAGVVAGYVTPAPAVIVTLRMPPPLDTPLAVRPDGEGVEVLAPDGALVAQAAPAPDPVADTGGPVAWDVARAAEAGYPGFVSHPFPHCFVCGPARADGLRIFPGRLADGRTATAWTVPDEIDPTLVWAALDCPGGWSVGVEARPYVLGRIAARIHALPEPGDRCVIVGRLLETEGRKAHVAVTMHREGELLASSRATWIALV